MIPMEPKMEQGFHSGGFIVIASSYKIFILRLRISWLNRIYHNNILIVVFFYARRSKK